MKNETIITGYSRGLNRWHDETGPFHAMHDKREGDHVFSVPLCGARPHSFGGHQALNHLQICRTCMTIMQQRIRYGMARAFFASAWADQCEETGHSAMLSGKEITDIMPTRLDPAAEHAARTLHFDMERVNAPQVLTSTFALHPGTPRLSLELWGHYAAMQSMGHGVGLWEYGIHSHGEPDGFIVPYVEFGSHSLERDYFTSKSEG